jgi:uncharacterized membrane protein
VIVVADIDFGTWLTSASALFAAVAAIATIFAVAYARKTVKGRKRSLLTNRSSRGWCNYSG